MPPSQQHTVELTLRLPDQIEGRSMTGLARLDTDRADYPVVVIPWSVFVASAEPEDPVKE
jgi:hypothetical protein